MLRPLAAALLAAALAAGSGAAVGQTRSMQGDAAGWRADPHIHLFYDAVRESCAQGCAHADVPALEARTRVIFADMARTRDMDAAAFQAHVAAIPRQMVAIGAEDPSILKSYDAFLVAIFGPA